MSASVTDGFVVHSFDMNCTEGLECYGFDAAACCVDVTESRTNGDGVLLRCASNALELARSSGAQVINQISTAYVVGRTQGVILEQPVTEPPHQNHYERSKVAAEAMMRAASGLRVRILRPSIVVGHSRTLAATTFSGFYGFARQLYQFRGVMERTQSGLLRERPLQMRVSPDQPLSMVPVDEVAAQSACIGLQTDAEGVYHLTQRQPRSIGDAILAVTRSLGFADPEFVPQDAPLDWLDAQLDKRLDFYGAYIQGTKHFDRRRSDAALMKHPETYRDLPPSADMAGWYLERLATQRTAMPTAR
jgi:nucleoside-diphosphate-sugar epimerase